MELAAMTSNKEGHLMTAAKEVCRESGRITVVLPCCFSVKNQQQVEAHLMKHCGEYIRGIVWPTDNRIRIMLKTRKYVESFLEVSKVIDPWICRLNSSTKTRAWARVSAGYFWRSKNNHLATSTVKNPSALIPNTSNTSVPGNGT